jgi:CDP-paratose 2-epimerase
MRMSCIYGQRQMGTEDQGWVAHFLIRALEGEPISIYGDGCQVRDVLDIADAVEAYARAWKRIGSVQGKAFNLGGGSTNAVSLRQLIRHIEDLIGRPVETVYSDWRAGDQRYYVSDTRLAARELALRPPTPWRRGVAVLAQWLQDERGLRRVPSAAWPRAAEALS